MAISFGFMSTLPNPAIKSKSFDWAGMEVSARVV
ncbi:MAG: hypothetical protein JNM09_01780 [Blastocatellia bacterium]|nr:hypothetical protein [Blastocatellia bacterium]